MGLSLVLLHILRVRNLHIFHVLYKIWTVFVLDLLGRPAPAAASIGIIICGTPIVFVKVLLRNVVKVEDIDDPVAIGASPSNVAAVLDTDTL